MKQRATVKQLEKVLWRNVTVAHSPEVKLWFAVLVSWIAAAAAKTREASTERKYFMEGEGFRCVCDALGLNPTYVRELVSAHLFNHLKKPVIDLGQDS